MQANHLERPSTSLALALYSLAPIYRHNRTNTKRTPARWDVQSESADSLPLWEATDRAAHRRLTFVFVSRVAYIETLTALAELWTMADDANTFRLY